MNEMDAIIAKFSGLAGALVSFSYLKGTLPEKVVNAIGGYFMSVYLATWFSTKTGLPESGAGFIVGFFGMAVCARVWEMIQTTPMAEVWTGLLKRAGLK